MTVKSNILTQRRKSEISQLEIIPTESWPEITDYFLSPVFSDEVGEDLTIVDASATWTEPTLAVTLVLMVAAVQDDETPPSYASFQVLKEVDGSELTFEDLGLGPMYVSLFGAFVPSDVGRFVPYIFKFTDSYSRESIIVTSASEIIAA